MKESFEKKSIDEHNRRFFENLQRIKPVYQTKQWEEDYKRQLYNQRFMRQVHYRRNDANNNPLSASSSLTSDDNLRKMSPKPESLPLIEETPLEQEKKGKISSSSSHVDRIRAYKQVLSERQAVMRQRQQQSMLLQRQRSSRLASLDPSAANTTNPSGDDNDHSDNIINGFEPSLGGGDDIKSRGSNHSSGLKKGLKSAIKHPPAKSPSKGNHGGNTSKKESNIAFSVFTGDDQYDHDGFFNEDDFLPDTSSNDDNDDTEQQEEEEEGQKMNIASIERQIKIIHEVMDIGKANPLASLTPHTGNKAGFLEQISYLDGTVECCLYPQHVVVLTVRTTAPYHGHSGHANASHSHSNHGHNNVKNNHSNHSNKSTSSSTSTSSNKQPHHQAQQTLQVEAEITTADLLMMTGDTILDPSDMSMLTSIAQEIVENVELRVDFNEAPKIILNLLHENNPPTQPSSPHARDGYNSAFGSTDPYDINDVDLEAVLLLQQSQASEHEVEEILLPDLQNNSLILTTTTRIPVALTNVLSHGNTGFSLASLNRVIDAAKQTAKVEYVMAMLQIRSLNGDQVSVHVMTVTSTKKMFIKRSPAPTNAIGGGKGSNISNMLLAHAPSHHQAQHAAVPANSHLTFTSSLPSVAQLDPELIVEFAENLAKNLRIDHDSKSGKNTLALSNPADAIKDR